jgi:hypothetical protein
MLCHNHSPTCRIMDRPGIFPWGGVFFEKIVRSRISKFSGFSHRFGGNSRICFTAAPYRILATNVSACMAPTSQGQTSVSVGEDHIFHSYSQLLCNDLAITGSVHIAAPVKTLTVPKSSTLQSFRTHPIYRPAPLPTWIIEAIRFFHLLPRFCQSTLGNGIDTLLRPHVHLKFGRIPGLASHSEVEG